MPSLLHRDGCWLELVRTHLEEPLLTHTGSCCLSYHRKGTVPVPRICSTAVLQLPANPAW